MAPNGARRDEILDRASVLFASSGLHTSLQDIADACGILPGSLYHHFESKESIIVELVRRYRDELDRVAKEALNAARRVRRGVRRGPRRRARRGDRGVRGPAPGGAPPHALRAADLGRRRARRVGAAGPGGDRGVHVRDPRSGSVRRGVAAGDSPRAPRGTDLPEHAPHRRGRVPPAPRGPPAPRPEVSGAPARRRRRHSHDGEPRRIDTIAVASASDRRLEPAGIGRPTRRSPRGRPRRVRPAGLRGDDDQAHRQGGRDEHRHHLPAGRVEGEPAHVDHGRLLREVPRPRGATSCPRHRHRSSSSTP